MTTLTNCTAASTVRITEARRAGAAAYRAGEPMTGGPYPFLSPLARAWSAGWFQAAGQTLKG